MDSYGLIKERRIRLAASSTCGTSLYHTLSGSFLGVEHAPIIKWLLNV